MKAKFILLVAIAIFITNVFTSCSKDDDESTKVVTKELSLKSGETAKIVIEPTNNGCTFTSENTFIASVSSTGEVKGLIVGETNIKVLNSSVGLNDLCKVKVSAQYQMYKEPYVNFGATQSQVKSNETRELLSELSGMLYKGENSKIDFVLYTFENGKLMASAALIPYSSSNSDLLVNFLSERYMVTTTGKDIVFLNTNKTIGGSISAQYYGGTYYYMVIYFPYTPSKSITTTL